MAHQCADEDCCGHGNEEKHSKRHRSVLEDIDEVDNMMRSDAKSVQTSVTKPSSVVELTDDQKQVLNYIQNGQSVFVTGVSGSGKTFMIPHIVEQLEKNGDKVAVTSTRAAGAVAIGGCTIQSFCGLGTSDEKFEVVRLRAQTKFMRDIYDSVDAIIIDDIQAMEPNHFLKIMMCAQIARSRRKDDIQWILLGDFFNRPPVGTKRFDDQNKATEAEFIFELDEWTRIIHHTIVLQKDLRHAADPVWSEVLQSIRWGQFQIHHQSLINRRVDVELPNDGIVPTHIKLVEDEVDPINNSNLTPSAFKSLSLKTADPTWDFFAIKGYGIGKKIFPYNLTAESKMYKELEGDLERNSFIERKKHAMLQFLEKNAPVDTILKLRNQAQVMLTTDLDVSLNLVTGSRGVVVGITKERPFYPVVRFANNVTVVVRSYMFRCPVQANIFVWYAQIPLKLGWAYSVRALTTHSIDRAKFELDKIVEYGMAYSILSKIRSLNDLQLIKVDWRCIRAHPKVQKYYSELNDQISKSKK